jgi:3-oxoacyl-ACP reductase-like protein
MSAFLLRTREELFHQSPATIKEDAMRRTGVLILAITLGCAAAPPPQTSTAASPPAAQTPVPAAPGQPAPAAAARPSGPIVNPSQETNDRIMNAVLARIAGRENEPAEQVFKNIQSMKGMPAGRLVRVMNMGYSRALGVACAHCHFSQDYSSDEKRQKRAAREMMAMNKMINERLRSLENLEGKPEEKFVSCTTCHRGQVDPNE